MNVFMIGGDGDFFGANYSKIKQYHLIRDADHCNMRVPKNLMIEASYYFSVKEREPIMTDFGRLAYETTLLLHRPRTDVIRPMLELVGAVLPMSPWRGESFEAFICETQLDAIDQEGMEYYPGDHPIFGDMVRRYAFKAEALRHATVFRLLGFPARLFATDRFLDLVQAHGLTGLRVLPLWSSDTGSLGDVKDPMTEFERYPPGFGSTPQEKRAAMRAILARRGDLPPS